MTKEEAIKKIKEWDFLNDGEKEVLETLIPELAESEDERIRKAQLDYWRSVGGKEWHGVPVQEAIAWLEKQGKPKFADSEDDLRVRKALIRFHKSTIDIDGIKGEEILAWLKKQSDKPQGRTVLETWKDMRLEVYQQASGNRHEPNYSDDTTKMFSLNDIDEIIEKNK